ncbi:MAG: dephospho-CoA kinase [Acidobacteria bacterium]|nr:dephospho-CoA kinase [Acidobacteriota bacterium]
MLRAGLTGGLATGKSFVGRALRDLGCHLIQADEIGHEVLRKDGPAYAAVIREFGGGIAGADGEIDRSRLGAEVFGRPDRLAVLNAIVHPLVIQREEELIAAAAAEDPSGIAVVEAAILIETGSYKRFDRLILVLCSQEEQFRRAVERGLSPDEVRARLARQMPMSEKRKYAQYVIDTSGAKEDTLRQTCRVYESLRSIAR